MHNNRKRTRGRKTQTIVVPKYIKDAKGNLVKNPNKDAGKIKQIRHYV